MSNTEVGTQEVHFNIPQIRTRLISAQEIYCIWGRGTGKSTGALAPFSLNNILSMPRSNGTLMGATYEQILIRTLPPLMTGWEREGFIEGVHFFVGKFAPKKWNWQKAYVSPLKAHYYIHFYNGSGIYLISQDRAGTSNGLSMDWLMGDEAKLLKKDRLDEETIPTLRGNNIYFGNLYNHLSTMFTTDMPKNPSGKWILEKEELVDREHIERILKISLYAEQLKAKLLTEKKPTIRTQLARELKKLNSVLNEARKGTVYVDYASTLDNIHALGIKSIKNLKRLLSDLDFQTSVLNRPILQAETRFYAHFDDEYHSYTNPNYSYIDGLNLDYRNPNKHRDCRWDNDLDLYAELDISLDYNAKINSLVCGQWDKKDKNLYKILSSFFVTHPHRLEEVINVFCKYYYYHKHKIVNYYYDHTAVGTNAIADISAKDVVIEAFKKHGWRVNPIYTGQAPTHYSRFIFFGQLFKEDNPKLPIVRINSTNAENYITSLNNTEVRKDKHEVKKDKRSEHNPNIKPQDATHLSEAGDGLLYNKFSLLLKDSLHDLGVPV